MVLRRSKYFLLATFTIAITCILSCKESAYSPKPRGYFRIDLPEKSYTLFDSTYPYKFEYPAYGELQPVEKGGERYWLNIVFPQHNATIYLSYKELHNDLAAIIEESHKMSYQHSIKADAMSGTVFLNDENKVYGLLTDIEGDAASAVQFYLTDSVTHFLRGALYFDTQVNSDSLAPLVSFFKEDIQHLMETIEWKNKK